MHRKPPAVWRLRMTRHMDFIGQRADKTIVKEVTGVEEFEDENGVIRSGVVKRVEHYTVSCDECGGDGYYDQRGEIICDGCGMVLSKDRQAVLAEEFSDSDSMGKGRGLQKMGDQRGTHEPSI